MVLDLSALYNSPALGVLMACATAWLQAALARQAAGRPGGGGRVLVVVDEAWAVLANLGVARWLQASWKLSRAYGVANVAVLHRLSDLQAVGAAGSEQVGLARGLLSDSETRVVYAQPPGEVAGAADLLSLSATEAELVPQLRRGVALWKVGRRSFLVQHLVGPAERALVDTDAAMAAGSTCRSLSAGHTLALAGRLAGLGAVGRRPGPGPAPGVGPPPAGPGAGAPPGGRPPPGPPGRRGALGHPAATWAAAPGPRGRPRPGRLVLGAAAWPGARAPAAGVGAGRRARPSRWP